MLMAVKNQFKVSLLTIKYALMREMLNKVTFLSNVIFMILNNASFIIQWIVLFSIKDNIAGASLKEIMLLWGFASSIFGISRFFFKNAFNLSDIITKGKLDTFLVQPKNVLISTITTDVESSAIGDMIYGFLMLCFYGLTFKRLVLFIFLSICGGLIITSISIIFSSFSFFYANSYMLADTVNAVMINTATYPGEIFKESAKIILYTIVPVGLSNYIPVELIMNFNIYLFIVIISVTILLIVLSFIIFNIGLKRYSSSNLMNARI